MSLPRASSIQAVHSAMRTLSDTYPTRYLGTAHVRFHTGKRFLFDRDDVEIEILSTANTHKVSIADLEPTCGYWEFDPQHQDCTWNVETLTIVGHGDRHPKGYRVTITSLRRRTT